MGAVLLFPLLIGLIASIACLLPLIWLKSPARIGQLLAAGLGLGFLAGTSLMLPGWWLSIADASRWWLFLWPCLALVALWRSRKAIAEPEKQASAWLYPALLMLLFTASTPLFLFASSALLAQQAALLALLMLPALILSQRHRVSLVGFVGQGLFGLLGLWLNALLYTEASPWLAGIVLLAASPRLLHWRRLEKLPAGLAHALVIGIPVLVLTGLVTTLWLSGTGSLYFG